MTASSSEPAAGTEPSLSPLARRLAEATLALVDVPSPSWQEQAALDHCAARLTEAGVPIRWGAEQSLLLGHVAAPGPTDRKPLVVLAGHLDTVPEQGNLPGRIDGDRVYGLGSTDMKGACAVIVELVCALWAERETLDCCVGGVLFAREELPFGDSALTPLLAAEADLDAAELEGAARLTDADVAVVMEPTSGKVQAGCLGNLNATVRFTGRSAHSARPWQGENALDSLGATLVQLASVPAIEHEFAGLTYSEVITATGVRGGVARNVVPGEASVDVNYRYPPGMSAEEADETLRSHLRLPEGSPGTSGDVEIIGHAPSGAVTVDEPLVQRLIALTGAAAEPKQAWTPVAELTLAGVPAVNFGPGDPPLAHQVDEHVRIDGLVHAYETLEALLRHGRTGPDASAAA
ncbi:MAG: succinyl-diaminopimelate desuccinylase [Solirubrobacteraceae bacterium]|nr:succinyl-diaminopimelate desuccinylase [Patulibacter sp.]